MTIRIWLSIVALCSCGPPPRPAPAPVAAIAAPPRPDGHWRWSHQAVGEDGVLAVESELWRLSSDGAAVIGTCDRTVTFRSGDAVPFACSQSTEYTLRTRYHLDGTLDGAAIALREASFETAPSPCEPARRQLTAYTGTVGAARLELAWPGGRQTLARADEERAGEPSPLVTAPGPLTGEWSWRTEQGPRREDERWRLDENSDGIITGTVERIVAGGDGPDCPSVLERYLVRGQRTAEALALAETSFEFEVTTCERHETRTLDAASGTIYPDAIVLTWRGGKRQVLHRAQP